MLVPHSGQLPANHEPLAIYFSLPSWMVGRFVLWSLTVCLAFSQSCEVPGFHLGEQ